MSFSKQQFPWQILCGATHLNHSFSNYIQAPFLKQNRSSIFNKLKITMDAQHLKHSVQLKQTLKTANAEDYFNHTDKWCIQNNFKQAERPSVAIVAIDVFLLPFFALP